VKPEKRGDYNERRVKKELREPEKKASDRVRTGRKEHLAKFRDMAEDL